MKILFKLSVECYLRVGTKSDDLSCLVILSSLQIMNYGKKNSACYELKKYKNRAENEG